MSQVINLLTYHNLEVVGYIHVHVHYSKQISY